MRAVLTNFGTTGDVLPLVALAVALRRRGHQVTMAFAPTHRETIARYDLEFAPVGADVRELQDAINQRWIDDESIYEAADEMTRLLAPLQSALPQSYEELRQITRHADVLISGPAQPVARMVHETTGIPFVSVQVSNFGGGGAPALRTASAALINPLRQKLGLRPLLNPLTTDANSEQLALYAMSRHLIARAPNAPASHCVTGFFFLDPDQWAPDRALDLFMSAGPPPVIVSFGSMPRENADRLLALAHELAGLADVRVLIQSGDRCDTSIDGAGRVCHTGFVPHAWLLPRGCCTVHHGGAGTAAAAFRSGRPSVYVPHGRIFDQHYWAELSRQLGCSGEAIPIGQLTADRLAASVRAALDSSDCRSAAARLGRLVQDEGGVSSASMAIEELVARIGLADDVGVPEERCR